MRDATGRRGGCEACVLLEDERAESADEEEDEDEMDSSSSSASEEKEERGSEMSSEADAEV